jgi:hypothetical protein
MSSHIARRQRGLSARGSCSMFWQRELSTGDLSHHFSQRQYGGNALRKTFADRLDRSP